MPAQSLPPMILITGGIAAAGGLQMGVHWIFKTDKPNDGPVQFKEYHGMDTWDYNMSMRDGKIFRRNNDVNMKVAWWDYPSFRRGVQQVPLPEVAAKA
ncbi:hypothetical protein T484DRAFT_1942523 [Baffinella frigidus]|nr:hypothetical protein T484DRAFT_1942523 [Cryptophyta sp. CCMP2293]